MSQLGERPYIGVTQGGSSRSGHPAKVAATRAQKRAELKQGETKDDRRAEINPDIPSG